MEKVTYIQCDQNTHRNDEIQACCICLESNCKLYNVNENNYYEVTSIPFPQMQGIPPYICAMCRAELQKCAAFRRRCQYTHRLLRQKYLEDEKLTKYNITQIKRAITTTPLMKGPLVQIECSADETDSGKKGKNCEKTVKHGEEKVKQEPEENDDDDEVLLILRKKPVDGFDFVGNKEIKLLAGGDIKTACDNENGWCFEDVMGDVIEHLSDDENSKPLSLLKEVLNSSKIQEGRNVRKRKSVTINDKEKIKKIKKAKGSLNKKYKKSSKYILLPFDKYTNIFHKYVEEKYVQKSANYNKADESVFNLFPNEENSKEVVACDEETVAFNEECVEIDENVLKDSESDDEFKKVFKKYVRKKYFNIYYENDNEESEPPIRTLPKTIKHHDEFAKAHNFEVRHLSLEEQRQELKDRMRQKNYQLATYTCELCYTGFQTESVYKEHLARHDKSHGEHKCPVCYMRFVSQRVKLKHMLSHKYKLVCKQCGMVFRSSTNAKYHFEMHAGVQYECKYCDQVFRRFNSRVNHYRIVHGGTSTCDICYRGFAKLQALVMHKTLSHRVTYPCNSCETIFDNANALEEHTALGKDCHNYKACSACGGNFSDEKLLNDHIVTYHTITKKKRKTYERRCCPCKCSNKTKESDRASESAKEIEQNNLTGLFETDNVIESDCPINNSTNNQNNSKLETNNLDNNTSNNENNSDNNANNDVNKRKTNTNKCDCPCKKFMVKKKNASDKNRKFLCEFCATKTFYSLKALKEHQLIHTGERPFQCNECSKTFRTKFLLTIHLRTHTNERPYQCEECGKTFKTYAARTRHNVIHTGERRYICSACGKRFQMSTSLKAHVKHVHMRIPAKPRIRKRKVKS